MQGKIALLYYKICYKLREYERKYKWPFNMQFCRTIRVYDTAERNKLLVEAITNQTPFLVGKFGATEMFAMRTVEFHDSRNMSKACKQLCEWSGFFPNNIDKMKEFHEIMKETASKVDILEKWDKPCEDYFIKKYCENLKGFFLHFANYLGELHSWSHILKGKRVLVIHPFEKSICEQYKKRQYLFPNSDVLPEFELLTIKAVQTLGANEDSRFQDWFEAYEYMCQEIDQLDFDVAFIGCGAYGLPLGAYIKNKGKVAIHLGGSLQLMFGILGGRWENEDWVNKIKNEYWIRPMEEERIEGLEKIEGGCYW